ncbi:hypothetical protein ACH4A7_37360 [Streptomyces cyaneofuscatus]|uniref:hypothetical protein n=1 Tax=Streptomyces cyaneofuscatus TaxID=66883 RepID=UPI00379420A6
MAGFVGTAGLKASLAPDPQPKKHVSAEGCELIADIRTQLDKAGLRLHRNTAPHIHHQIPSAGGLIAPR